MRIAGVAATWIVAALAGACAIIALAGAAPLGALDSPVAFLRLEFGLTPLASPFLALLAVLSFAVGMWSMRRAAPSDIALIAIFAFGMFAVLLAQSVASFFLAWEAMSLSSAFLVAAHHEHRSVRRATLTYLVVAQGGALCILVALIILAHGAGSTSFLAIARSAPALEVPARDAVFALALVGFGSKAGLLPLHFWLPRAHPVAPANASAMLSGAMLKVAIYGLALVTLELAAPASLVWGIAILAIGTVSAIVGVLYALVEHDLKRLLAYHSVENIGIIAIALGTALVARHYGAQAIASVALVAALFHSINHGLFKGLLFLGAGVVAESEGTVDLEKLGGLWAHLVWTAPLFLCGCIAIAGLPPFNGFASEWMTFQSLIAGLGPATFAIRLILAAAIAGLALTSGLAVACFVKVFGIVFLGRARRPERQTARNETFDPAVAGQAILAVSCVGLGLVPAVATVPLSVVARIALGATPLALPALPSLGASLIAAPLAGVVLVLALASYRGIRRVPTWTCGSPVTASAQYTATAFAKPLRTVFAFLLFPERRRRIDRGSSSWFPARIAYQTEVRYVIDENARRFAAFVIGLTRRSRLLQSGELRLYVAYAMAALVIVVVTFR